MDQWALPTVAVMLLAYGAVPGRLRSMPISQAMAFVTLGLLAGNLGWRGARRSGRTRRFLSNRLMIRRLVKQGRDLNPSRASTGSKVWGLFTAERRTTFPRSPQGHMLTGLILVDALDGIGWSPHDLVGLLGLIGTQGLHSCLACCLHSCLAC